MQRSVDNKEWFKKVTDAVSSFAIIALILLGVVIVLRLIELTNNLILHSFNGSLPKLLLSSLGEDLVFWLRFSTLFLLVYVPIYLLSRKVAYVVMLVVVFFYVVLTLSISQYFSKALVLLGADVYAYTFADIKQTVGASGQVSFKIIFLGFVLVALILSAFYFIPRRVNISRKFSYSFVLLMFLAGCLSSFIVIPKPSANSEFVNSLAANKTSYFVVQSLRHFFPDENDVDIYADSYTGYFSDGPVLRANFNYVDEVNFPFLHNDSTPDVLSPFLNKTAQPPNIVIVLVEGLGRAFTNEGAYLGNFTPFIDSLSNQSLYWENFLSEGGRTFAVLPSVLGSLPFLKNGFAEMGDKMPAHLSLVTLLKANGYSSSFHYGGDSKFDNMQMFLRKNNVDQIDDQYSFGSGFTKMPNSANGFSWGYGDKELFRHYFDTKVKTPAKPSLDILLTVSTHTPFLINEQQTYLDKFESRMNQLGFDEAQKKEHRDYKLQYASIMYADDAIKNFIATYSARPEFSNTIFLITGDHRMPEIPMVSKIDRYHVPLIIYSPLLNRKQKFSSISTHFDITPSILSYLKANFSIKVPATVAWMGNGLDTTKTLANNHAYPLLQTKNDLVDFVAQENLLNNKQLFKLQQGLESVIENDEAKSSVLQQSFDQFKRKNDAIISGKALWPDSILRAYLPR